MHVLIVKPGAEDKPSQQLGAKGNVVRLAGIEPPAGSTLRKLRAFQPPTLFDYSKGREDVSLDER